MKLWQVSVYGVALALLAGCNSLGLSSKPVDYRAAAVQAPSLEIPPDLTAPGKDERYRVPGSGENVATYSDYSKGGAATDRSVRAVLPELKSVKLERNGTQRWLNVKDKPENVWTAVKAFFQESGIAIKSEDQAAGVMETDWIEDIPNVQRSWFGRFLNKISSSSQRNHYTARLERGKDGLSTEVYLTHRGMEEVLSSDGISVKWQARPKDPEMEAVMLQRLMVRLGGSEAQAAISMADASGHAGAASLQEVSDGSRVMLVNDAFDRTWRRVGLAIERAGMMVEDKDREKGVYFLKPAREKSGWMEKLQFWKENNNSSRRYRVNVKEAGKYCEVSVTDQDGANTDTTQQMVESLYRNIDNGETAKAAGTAPMQATTIETTSRTNVEATGVAGTASLTEVFDGSNVIVVNDAFDKSWHRVGLALERAGIVVESNDRSKGVYLLRPEKSETSWMERLQFWNASENVVRYRVNVKDGGKACEVSVTDQNGVSNETARQMIKSIYKNISQ